MNYKNKIRFMKSFQNVSSIFKNEDIMVKYFKYIEEVGEIAQALLGRWGSKNASKSSKNGESLLEEVLDALIVAEDIIGVLEIEKRTEINHRERNLKQQFFKLCSNNGLLAVSIERYKVRNNHYVKEDLVLCLINTIGMLEGLLELINPSIKEVEEILEAKINKWGSKVTLLGEEDKEEIYKALRGKE